MIFVNSMSDLFHKEIPHSYITSVFETIEQADWHIYQVLTKRSSLLQKFVNARYKTRPAPGQSARSIRRNSWAAIPSGAKPSAVPMSLSET
jgi:protein gp37